MFLGKTSIFTVSFSCTHWRCISGYYSNRSNRVLHALSRLMKQAGWRSSLTLTKKLQSGEKKENGNLFLVTLGHAAFLGVPGEWLSLFQQRGLSPSPSKPCLADSDLLKLTAHLIYPCIDLFNLENYIFQVVAMGWDLLLSSHPVTCSSFLCESADQCISGLHTRTGINFTLFNVDVKWFQFLTGWLTVY